MNQLTRGVRYVAAGSLLLPGLGMLYVLACAIAEQLHALLGLPAAAAVLMLGLLCCLLRLSHGWTVGQSRDLEI